MSGLHCKLCQQPSQWKTAHRAFLKLAGFRPQLSDRLLGQPWRKPLDSWLRDTLEHLHDWGVTRPGDGGLDLQADGACRVHTWFMGLAGYMAAFREYADSIGRPELFGQYWQSGQGTLVHFLGFDCVFSHAVVYPAQLSVLQGIKVRQRFVPNQFLKLDGLNLSTSRNHAIWVGDLARQACADSARLYLASIAPEDSEGDFRMTHFLEWRDELFNGFFPALLEAAKSRGDSGWSGVCGTDAGLLEALRQQWSRAAEPAQFSMKGLAGVLLDAIAITRARLAEGRSVSHFVALIAVAGKALIPDMSAQLINAFGLPEARVNATLMNGSAAEYSI